MKKLLVLSAIAALTACGGSDNKPAGDPSTTSSTATPAAASSAATSATGTSVTPATVDSAKPADPTKK